ncbi:class I SAM-dependent methyltransferase [Candidatus Auribacterota bacterium]
MGYWVACLGNYFVLYTPMKKWLNKIKFIRLSGQSLCLLFCLLPLGINIQDKYSRPLSPKFLAPQSGIFVQEVKNFSRFYRNAKEYTSPENAQEIIKSDTLFGDVTAQEIQEILAFFIEYPNKLSYMGTIESRPIEKLVSLRQRLYRQLQKGNLKDNILKVRQLAESLKEGLERCSREHFSLQYELSLLGISPLDGTITVPAYLSGGEFGLKKETSVEVGNYPVQGEWTAEVGYREEMARNLCMQVSFQMYMGRVYDIRFDPDIFEDDLRSLQLTKGFLKDKDILEIGANEAHLAFYLEKLEKQIDFKSYVGLDWDIEALCSAHYSDTAQVLAANNKAIPFSDHSFDIMVLNNFIGPCYYKEMGRVLRPDGYVLVIGCSNKEGALPNGLYQYDPQEGMFIRVVSMLSEKVIEAFNNWIKDKSGVSLGRQYQLLLNLLSQAKQQGMYGSEIELAKIIEETFFTHNPDLRRYKQDIRAVTKELFAADGRTLPETQRQELIQQIKEKNADLKQLLRKGKNRDVFAGEPGMTIDNLTQRQILEKDDIMVVEAAYDSKLDSKLLRLFAIEVAA